MTEAVVMADAENATASWHGRLERRGSSINSASDYAFVIV